MLKLGDAQKQLAARLFKKGIRPRDWPPLPTLGVPPIFPPLSGWSVDDRGAVYGRTALCTGLTRDGFTAWCEGMDATPAAPTRPAPKDPGVSETLCRRLKAKGFHMGNWPSPEAAEVMDAWLVGPSGAEYRGNAASPQAVTFNQYASWLGNMPTQGYRVGFLGTATGLGVVRYVGHDKVKNTAVWFVEGDSTYASIDPHDIKRLPPVEVLERTLQNVSWASPRDLAKLIIEKKVHGVKYEA
jgi:hypothetical protein